MIDLTGATPAWPRSAERSWQRSLAEAARQTAAWAVFCPQGDELLREQLGRIHGLDPRQLTITASVRATALTYRRRERVILMERPTFDGALYAISGGTARVLRRSWRGLLHGQVPAGALVWLTSPCRNPDGATLTESECTRLGEWCRRGRRVVVNAAYLWFAPDSPRVPGADLAGSLHKVAGRGARLAWVHSPDFHRDAFAELIGVTPPPVWQRAWGLFAADGGLETLAADVVGRTALAVDAFHEGMRAKLGYGLPRMPGPNLLLRLAPGLTEEHAVTRLGELGFELTAGAHFGAQHPALRANFTGVRPEAAADFARVASDPTLFAWPEGPAAPGGLGAPEGLAIAC